MNLTSIGWYCAVLYFIIGGTFVAVSSIEPIIISVPSGIAGVFTGFFLLWLDRKYDLN
jgi:hypothetical protein